ncbi:TadE/TadG family type IV pilus assembly protein [Bradyrhizobium sp.]|jgi:Flp pilus assembly protein TadG|uniref:TadE/TadG family type IV pilus assembly protein n=1 Tax=Bradyrhizobium sp. TaxID=376 RepID=UPI002E07D366|nr:TadE/TadG family type IV pilus assembly protein [Bradyrhizobium sp.]
MSSSADSVVAVRKALRRFRRNRRGSAAVEFALVAPAFFGLLFAIMETALVFFAGQVLETGVQDTSRLFYTSQSPTEVVFKQALCDRVATLFACANVCTEVRSYNAGSPITITDPIDSSGNFSGTCTYQPPTDPTQTVVIRGFYQWPLVVTGLGYNIANIGRGTSNSKKLLAATIALRPQ